MTNTAHARSAEETIDRPATTIFCIGWRLSMGIACPGGDPINRPPVNIRKPRCFLVYALAPEDVSPPEANQVFNAFVADRDLPLVLFHDHFIGQAGGFAIFYAETAEDREALFSQRHLTGWDVEVRPLIYARSPSAFDEQTAFTLRAYRGQDWARLRKIKRPSYGAPSREAETASEDSDGP